MTVTTSGASSVVQCELPETPRFHAVVATVIGAILEWFDFGAYAFLATIIARHFFPTGDEVVVLMSTFAAYGVGFVARLLGAVFFGCLGDNRCRRLALLISMRIMGIGTLLSGSRRRTPPSGCLRRYCLSLGASCKDLRPEVRLAMRWRSYRNAGAG